MLRNKSEIAIAGEEIAATFLKNNGYNILYKNWRHSNIGEIDIIASKNNEIVFVEVKTRTNHSFGEPIDSINQIKQKKIIKLAQVFISQNSFSPNTSFRFDAIGIILAKKIEINHIQSAYTA